MRGYAGLTIASSACVRFVHNDELDDSLPELAEDLRTQGLMQIYVDCCECGTDTAAVINAIAVKAKFQHAPYASLLVATRFWDDMITLSTQQRGLVIVIDHADVLLEKNRRGMFDLIEAFLVQMHHWLEQGKPCHLCLHIESSEAVRAAWAHGS